MEKIHVIFIGGRKEAAIESLKLIENGLPANIIAVYTDRSKEVWKEVKREIGKLTNIREEHTADYGDISSIIQLLNQINRKNKGRILLNITGLSKEGLIAVLLYYGYFDRKSSRRAEIAMLQVGKRAIIFSPEIILYFGCPKNGRKGNLKKEIMDVLAKNNGKMSMKELVKQLGRTKATISEAIKNMELKKMIKKERRGKEIIVILNEFMYDLLKKFKGGVT